jgi:ABC-2 type transport system ATP-binding protein
VCYFEEVGRLNGVPAVEVSHLAKRYTPTAGVSDVSFTAESGAVTALLGRNGAGKTTTVEVCSGLRKPDSGTIRVLGHEPASQHRELVTRIGVMPQAGGSSASGVYPSARVGEVLDLFAAQYAAPLPVGALMERLDLAGVRNTPWRRLSGGEQQRLSFALALVGRPELVFLDEPTAGLDVHARRTTWDLINELRAAGVGAILTTHALDEAEQLADFVVIVDHGRVVASGSPADLTRSAAAPQLTFTAPPGLDVTALSAALPDGATAREAHPGRYVVGPRLDPDVVAAVTAWCASSGVLPDNLTTKAGRSLEAVFVELTAGESAP